MGVTGVSDVRLADQAAIDARRSAERASVIVREVTSSAELSAIATLFIDVWSADEPTQPVSSDLLRALSHAGNYVAAAFTASTGDAGGDLVGASVGFFGHRTSGYYLHSHITGVARAAQNRSVGAALKWHQRAWALARGVDEITWTFDPLVRRNAYFNLVKLGASIVDYQPQFYGTMQDGVNRGDESDRAVVSWALTDRADNAAVGAPVGAPVDEGAVGAPVGAPVDEGAGADVLVRPDRDGGPVVASPRGAVLKAWVPEDIVELRRADPPLALAWRRALRETFGAAIRDGYVARTVSRDGWYVLARPQG